MRLLSHMGHFMGLLLGTLLGAICLLLVLGGYPKEKLLEVARRMKTYGLDQDEE
jgi:hypothetical protein